MLINEYKNEAELREEEQRLAEEQYQKDCQNILEECVRLGVLGYEDDNSSSIMSEAGAVSIKQGTNVMSKQGRQNFIQSMHAISLAKRNKDALYTKLVKTSRKRKQLIKQINQKYKANSLQFARKAIREYSKASNVGAIANKNVTVSSKEAKIKQHNENIKKQTNTKKK